MKVASLIWKVPGVYSRIGHVKCDDAASKDVLLGTVQIAHRGVFPPGSRRAVVRSYRL